MSDLRDLARGDTDTGLDARPVSPAGARARAARLAGRLADREARLSVGVDLLEQAEHDALAHLDELIVHTVDLARAGGIEVVLDEPPVVAEVDDALHPAVIEAEQILAEQRRVMRRGRHRPSKDGAREGRVTFVVSFALFVAVGYVATAIGGMIPGDAISRVGSGQAVVISRDPHLEAIGFIWGPFPTMFQLPLIALRTFWLPMTSAGMAAIIVSAAFMAGALRQLLAWGRECGAGRAVRYAAVVLVVLHPLLWTHGANGMSEACWIFFLLLAMRHLALWIETDDVRSLVIVGVAIAMGYLTRYETAGVFLAVLPVVAVTTWNRSMGDGDARSPLLRQRETVLDLAIFSFPVVVTVAAWAGASWAIIGIPFTQFDSNYGNSALVKRSAADTILLIGDPTSAGRAWFYVRQLVVASPLLAVLALLALWGTRRGAMRAVVALAVLGAPLALQLVFASKGSTFPWLRYVIIAVPLAGALVLVIAGSSVLGSRRAVTAFALLTLVPGIFWTEHVVVRNELASFDQTETLDAVRRGIRGDSVPEGDSVILLGQRAAAEIDRMPDVEAGTILMDQASIGVLPAAPRPNVYVIPSDRDFEPALNAPEDFGIRFILLVEANASDQVGAHFPTMWSGGGSLPVRLAAEWGDDSNPKLHMRLYELLDPDPNNRAKPDLEFGR